MRKSKVTVSLKENYFQGKKEEMNAQGIIWYEISFILGEGREKKIYNESFTIEMI